MRTIESIHEDIQNARRRHGNQADGRSGVTRSEAIEIVRRAAAAGASTEDIHQAFDEAGDNGFGEPMAAYLRDLDVVRIIGSAPPPRTRLPHPPELRARGMAYGSSYGQLTLRPEAGTTETADAVSIRATCPNPHPNSSQPGETPLVYGRDGLFDQVLLHLYGYAAGDPLSDEDLAMATELARDPQIRRAREQFIEAAPGALEITLPRHPQLD